MHPRLPQIRLRPPTAPAGIPLPLLEHPTARTVPVPLVPHRRNTPPVLTLAVQEQPSAAVRERLHVIRILGVAAVLVPVHVDTPHQQLAHDRPSRRAN